MKILALDTATEACSVALWVDGVVHAEARELARGHAQHILPMVDALLGAHALQLADLDAIAVGRGPGGFTGVRLAVGVAQGLALGAGLPAVGISDLAAVAQAVFDRDALATHVLACNDARMKEVYTGLFARGAAGLAVPDGAERVAPPDSVAVPPSSGPQPRRVIGAGRGFRAFPQLARRLHGELASIDDSILPGAGEIARLAAAAFRRGEAVAPENLQPVYLRDDVAIPAVTILK
ncbi:MAG: tRNA (adenosine(37)-N6)-threonylcarbamoyltransferase complex dimerization subunit type 1 TsaB [Steroidobacteraceae bacterium]